MHSEKQPTGLVPCRQPSCRLAHTPTATPVNMPTAKHATHSTTSSLPHLKLPPQQRLCKWRLQLPLNCALDGAGTIHRVVANSSQVPARRKAARGGVVVNQSAVLMCQGVRIGRQTTNTPRHETLVLVVHCTATTTTNQPTQVGAWQACACWLTSSHDSTHDAVQTNTLLQNNKQNNKQTEPHSLNG